MLKSAKTIAALFISAAAVAMPATADINSDLKNICTIVQTDDKGELRKKMRMVKTDYRLDFNDVYTGISCGGESLIRTAMKNSAVETGTLMIKKLPKTFLEQPEKDGKTLAAWAQDNGFGDSPIFTELKDRI